MAGSVGQKLVVGSFFISPASGSINPGNSQVVNVDFHAEKKGIHEEVR